ncbi:hypothetical protein L5515_017066 [Caenorhabditis briggsae]|uniref:Uncharacterized protein n=1 Tax=Caenorhabditis briggsae TaxID=6238 RepID=A0AAE9JQT6_CAEBR|nr:hypothetical protein L5515_017066 [Caenorhabditis briggsae]
MTKNAGSEKGVKLTASDFDIILTRNFSNPMFDDRNAEDSEQFFGWMDLLETTQTRRSLTFMSSRFPTEKTRNSSRELRQPIDNNSRGNETNI